jgi:hypothetical protein
MTKPSTVRYFWHHFGVALYDQLQLFLYSLKPKIGEEIFWNQILESLVQIPNHCSIQHPNRSDSNSKIPSIAILKATLIKCILEKNHQNRISLSKVIEFSQEKVKITHCGFLDLQ